MIYLVGLSADDILRDVDPATGERSGQCNAQLYRVDLANAALDFVTSCALSRNNWEQRVQLMDFNYIVPEEDREILDPGISWEQLKVDYEDLVSSSLKLHCSCPAYIYWGKKYIMTELDTALEEEFRFPEIRNPTLEGTVCKHLIAVLRRYF